MSDAGKPGNWWHTLPGVITGIAAILTALTGLVVAIKQTGWFDSPAPPVRSTDPASSPPPLPAPPGMPAPALQPSPATASGATPRVVALPQMRDYKLGPQLFKATFTLLAAALTAQTAEKDALSVRLRMVNHDQYDHVLSDRSFRLVVDGVAIAPEGSLNELVPAKSAREGEVSFVVARGTTAATLTITYYESSTEIPVTLTPR